MIKNSEIKSLWKNSIIVDNLILAVSSSEFVNQEANAANRLKKLSETFSKFTSAESPINPEGFAWLINNLDAAQAEALDRANKNRPENLKYNLED